MFSRKSDRLRTPDGVPTDEIITPKMVERYRRLQTGELIEAIEAELGRSGELLRGFSHRELDPAWVASELRSHLTAAAAASAVLDRREQSKALLS